MPYKDPEVRRIKAAGYFRKWASKPSVKARRRKYARDLIAGSAELQQRQRDRDRAYRESHREERRAYAAAYRARPDVKDRRYEQIKAAQARAKAVTDTAASRKGRRWTPEEDAIVSNLELTHVEAALLTGRTYSAISARRRDLRQRQIAPKE